MGSNRRGAFLVVGVVGLSAALGGIYGPSVRATAAGTSDAQQLVKDFTRVLAIVEQNYAEPVDVERAIENGAIPGMLRVLDPHSGFYDARQFALLREDQRGKYYGVGMTVAPRDGHTAVLAPFFGSPAYKAGIRPGDIILKVDGKSADGLSTVEVADLLKGPKGTVVRITIAREGFEQSLNFTVVRDEIPRHGVDNPMLLRPGIGYIRVASFNETTDRELAEALQKLNASSLQGLVLDLRNNPGGLLNEGVAVADMFLEKNQLIVSHRGRSSPERRYFAVHGNRGVEVPLVILINGQSASASEIVAGAVQDHDRGLIVGETSFGKGLVQNLYQLSENTGLAMTTAKWYTPSGRLIQRDYKSVSLYDYQFNRGKSQQPTEIKLTDSGRQVYGGGGITPDVIVATPKLDRFQLLLLRRDVFYPFEMGVGGFTRHYLALKPTVAKDFAPDQNALAEFRRYLSSQGIRYTEADIQEHQGWIQRKIKREVFLSEFGQAESYKVEIDDDGQVQKAIALIPEARALYQNAKKILAQRQAAQGTFR